MAITEAEILELMNAFHDAVMLKKATAAEQAAFFLEPDQARIFVPHGEDVSMEANYEIHQKLTGEKHIPVGPWDLTPLCAKPERVRAVGAVYWEGRIANSPDGVIKCMVGEDWIVQRQPSGELKIALYINPYHRWLPDSAPFDIG